MNIRELKDALIDLALTQIKHPDHDAWLNFEVDGIKFVILPEATFKRMRNKA